MNDSKSIFKSKTFWANVTVAVVSLAGATFFSPDSETPKDLDSIAALWLTFCVGVGNIVLRYLTKQPVNIGGK